MLTLILTMILTMILTLMLALVLTLILFIPLLRFDLCVMLTFRSELHWVLGGNCEVSMVFAVLM